MTTLFKGKEIEWHGWIHVIMQMKMETMSVLMGQSQVKVADGGVVMRKRRKITVKRAKRETELQLRMRQAEAREAAILAKCYERAELVNLANYYDELKTEKQNEILALCR